MVMGISIGTDWIGALCAVRHTDLLKAEITDIADIPQFNNYRIMQYIFSTIAEIYCETANNRLLLLDLS